MEMLLRSSIDPAGQESVIVGRSDIVGKPMALLLMHEHATVTICHSATRDIKTHCCRADILIAAMGVAEFVKADMVKPGAVVVDVGINAVAGPDGKPADYSKENVPYKPKHWLKVAAEGTRPGDLVFVVGYPGRTQRHQTYAEVKETVEWALPRSIRLSEEQLALIDTLTKENPALAIKLAGRVQGLNNGLTNSRGVPPAACARSTIS